MAETPPPRERPPPTRASVFFSSMLGRPVRGGRRRPARHADRSGGGDRRALPAGREPGRQGPGRPAPVPVERRGAARRRRPHAPGRRRGLDAARRSRSPTGSRWSRRSSTSRSSTSTTPSWSASTTSTSSSSRGSCASPTSTSGFRGLIRRMGWEPFVDRAVEAGPAGRRLPQGRPAGLLEAGPAARPVGRARSGWRWRSGCWRRSTRPTWPRSWRTSAATSAPCCWSGSTSRPPPRRWRRPPRS